KATTCGRSPTSLRALRPTCRTRWPAAGCRWCGTGFSDGPRSGACPRTETEITERTVAQEERRNGERTEKTKIDETIKVSCLLRLTSVAPFLLLIRVLRELRTLAKPSPRFPKVA